VICSIAWVASKHCGKRAITSWRKGKFKLGCDFSSFSGSICTSTSAISSILLVNRLRTISPIWWPSDTLRRESTKICTSTKALAPILRVRKSCSIWTPSTDLIIFLISISWFLSNPVSTKSLIPSLPKLQAIWAIIKLTPIAARASKPDNPAILPATPSNTIIDEIASLRWCQAFACNIGERTCLATWIVYWYKASLIKIDSRATARLTGVGCHKRVGSNKRRVASINMPAATKKSKTPTATVAKVSKRACP